MLNLASNQIPPTLPQTPGKHTKSYSTQPNIPSINATQTQKAIADQHGCLPAPRLPNQRPFGIDRLQQIFRADAESRLNEYFLSNFRQMGNTLERSFLGTSVWGTIEPANLEAVLSTKFKGMR
jgi:hypothetical protein